MTVSLRTAANGHLMLEFGSRGTAAWRRAEDELERTLGFTRRGDTVEGIGDGIAPSFVHGARVIAAGWDEWAGDYLLAACAAGDQVLQALAQRLATA